MTRSVTTPIKSFRPQRTGKISSSDVYRGILKPRYDSYTRSDSINILTDLPHVTDTYWYIYNKYDYIGKMDAFDIPIVYTDEINMVASNARDQRHYGTSNLCVMCGKTGHNFDECELLKTMTY